MLAQPGEQLVATHPGLLRQHVDVIRAECLGEIVGRDRLVLAVTNPGLRLTAVAVLLHLLDQIAKTAAQHAATEAARENVAESA
jgi:hypothetical protein